MIFILYKHFFFVSYYPSQLYCCVSVGVHEHMYVHECAYMHACTCACVYASVCVCSCPCVAVCVHTCACVYGHVMVHACEIRIYLCEMKWYIIPG